MKLRKLLKEIPAKLIKGSKDLTITGVCANSKLVAPGNLFIARKGRTEDGAFYIPEAVAAGAVAILTDIYDPLISKSVTQIIYPDIASLECLVAASYYQFPSKELFMVGITGTNGKTTTSFFVKHLLDHLNIPCGLIGTIEYIIGQHRYQATRTTPDAPTTQKMLREMIIHNCQSAVMEVSSHALDQNRIDQIEFDAAVFTNLTHDHLDYHQTMESYSKAKNILFQKLDYKQQKKIHPFKKVAIVNADSSWHKQILMGCFAKVITYGIDCDADLKAEEIKLSSTGTTFTLNYRSQKAAVSWPIVGRFNVYNCLAASAVALSRNIPLEKIALALQSVPPVSGRLEVVPNALDLKIYVDFAHSEDAIENVLTCLQEFNIGRIIVVFGCGGNRDAAKRPKMAKVCEKYADIVIVTSDNPRNENPADIVKEIVKGFLQPQKHFIEIDRSAAIEKAIDMATPQDIILITGKGHEPYQIFAHKTIEFDDRVIASQLCQKKSLSASLTHRHAFT